MAMATTMPPNPKYQPLDADDRADADDGVAPLELEDARVPGEARPPRRACGALPVAVACLASLLLATAGHYLHREGGGENAAAAASAWSAPAHLSIFCYGDSLTYGISGGREPYPYARYLEAELTRLVGPANPPPPVHHLGVPGWTAHTMLLHMHDESVGLCRLVRDIPTLALVILLVGTNDIGVMTNSDKAGQRAIVEDIVQIHEEALRCAEGAGRAPFHTLAVGIPGSAFQDRVRAAADAAAYVNAGVAAFAASRPTQVTYAEFPIPYREAGDDVAVGDELWAPDGVHLTQVGYAALAKGLAPRVQHVLDHLEVWARARGLEGAA